MTTEITNETINQNDTELVKELEKLTTNWLFLDRQLCALEKTSDIKVGNKGGSLSFSLGSASLSEIKEALKNSLMRDKSLTLSQMSEIIEKLKNPS